MHEVRALASIRCLPTPAVWLLAAAFGAGCSGQASPQSSNTLPTLAPRRPNGELVPPGPVVPEKRVTIAWTGEVRGELDVCGCPTVPYGGFERRERYLQRLRAEGDPVIVLDAGDMLTKGARGAKVADQELRAKTMLSLGVEVGLDVWCPSPTDLALRPADGKGWERAVGTNVDELPHATVIERGGVRLGVVGVSGAMPGHSVDAGVVDVVKRAMAAVSPSPDAWVALSNADTATNTRIAEGVPGLALVLATRGGDLDPPRVTSGAPVIETPDRGRFVSVVRLAIGTTPGPAELLTGPEGAKWEAWDEAMERLPRQEGNAKPAEAQRVVDAWAAVAPDAAGRNLALVRDRPLGSDLEAPDDAAAKAVKAFDDSLVGTANARSKVNAPLRYVAAGGCTGCHDDYLAAWAETPHAKAWLALIPRGGNKNPECVACHSTGWGEPGGNASTDDVNMQTWKAVQCEDCHGPMSAHIADPHNQKGQPVTEATCLTCHDPANSPQFDYATYHRRVSCVNQMAGQGVHVVTPPSGKQ